MAAVSEEVRSEADRLWSMAGAAFEAECWDEAKAILVGMLERWPNLRPALHQLGLVLQVTGHPAEAEGFYRQALALDPSSHEARYALSRTLAIQGRYTEAQAFMASRFEVPQTKQKRIAYPRPEWRGEDLTGKRIVVFPEQGLGDQIQMARFGKTLKERGAAVTWLCNPALHRLFAQSLDVPVIAASGAVQFDAPDVWTTIIDLPGLLGIDRGAVSGLPYLTAEPRAVASGGIGFVTRGRPTHGNDKRRSLSGHDADRLREVLGEAIDLDPEQTGAQDFSETASIVAGLDLVVTVDTAVAHLAGALGKPVWILLPDINTDWRWGRGSDRTPWYPTAKLFRSSPDGSWSEAIDAVSRDLGRV